MNEFVNALKNSTYFHLLTDKYDAVLIYLSGSRLVGITDDHSDFDIVVLVNDDVEFKHQSEFLVWHGHKVHWYFRTLLNFVNTPDDVWSMEYVGLIEYAFFNDECIIYQKPDSDIIISNLMLNKLDIARVGCYKLYEHYQGMIEDFINDNEIAENRRTKMVSHLVLASHILIGDEIDKDAYMRIKRMRWTDFAKDDEQLAIHRLRLLKDYIESNPIDMKQLITKISMCLSE